MFDWLNKLQVGDKVVVRDSSHLITDKGPTDSTEVVTEVTDDHIKTAPLEMAHNPPPRIDVWSLFERRFGSSNTLQLVQK